MRSKGGSSASEVIDVIQQADAALVTAISARIFLPNLELEAVVHKAYSEDFL